MAITTIAGARAGILPPIPISKSSSSSTQVSGRTAWAHSGFPRAGAYDTTLNGVTCGGSTLGRLPFTNPPSGNTYIAGGRLNPFSNTGIEMLCDRLWHNGGIDVTSTSPQSITSPTWPARDENASTNGVGVFLALECSASCGAAAPTITVSYTNSSGTSGRTGVNTLPVASSPAALVFSTFHIGLDTGDVGVRSVESITLSASWLSGTVNLVAFRPIWIMPQLTPTADDPLTSGFPRVFDDSCLYWQSCEMNVNSGSAGAFGVVRLAQG